MKKKGLFLLETILIWSGYFFYFYITFYAFDFTKDLGISIGLIAFTMSFDDFIISYFVTGNGVNNISILVYTMSKRVNPSINALSTLVIAIITVVLIVVNVVPIIKEKRRKKV